MKSIILFNKKEYLITDQEFKAAYECWRNKTEYWCPRLETLLFPHSIVVAGTPAEDLGYEVFITKGTLPGSTRKIFKLGDKYFSHVFSGDGDEIGKKQAIKLTPEQIVALVSQEKYYEGQKQLTA